MSVSHHEMVAALVKPGTDILKTITAKELDLWHGATGVSGEAGELLDAVKKHVIYKKPLDRENLVEELGDIEFYLEQVRQNAGITREETIAANIYKLAEGPNARYKKGYSDQAAQDRADKVQEHTAVTRAAGIPTDNDYYGGGEHSAIMEAIGH